MSAPPSKDNDWRSFSCDDPVSHILFGGLRGFMKVKTEANMGDAIKDAIDGLMMVTAAGCFEYLACSVPAPFVLVMGTIVFGVLLASAGGYFIKLGISQYLRVKYPKTV